MNSIKPNYEKSAAKPKGKPVLCSIGSNIAPTENIKAAILMLGSSFETLSLSPLIKTKPQGDTFTKPFLNALFVIHTELKKNEIKEIFNDIEYSLGRDRDHPESSTRDREVDIDIITIDLQKFELNEIHEPYFKSLIADLQSGQPVSKDEWINMKLSESTQLSDKPTTIYCDNRTGHVSVLNNKFNCFDN